MLSSKKSWTTTINLINNGIDPCEYSLLCDKDTKESQLEIFNNIEISAYPSSVNYLQNTINYLSYNSCDIQTIGTWDTCKIPQYVNIDLTLRNPKYGRAVI